MKYTKGNWEIIHYTSMPPEVVAEIEPGIGINIATVTSKKYEADSKLIAAAPIGYELAEAVINSSATWISEGLLEIGEAEYIRLKEIALKFRAKANGDSHTSE